MIHLLLAVIYLSFISLGLPDSLLGAAWPKMYLEFGVPVSSAGIISMIISMGTINVYPPLHGIGCAEAESPYPDAETEETFQVGMTVNTDISLFGLPGGSNRIEEGFVITDGEAESLSPFIAKCCEEWEG